MSDSVTNRIWITWEHHRRSIELAKELKCVLYTLEYSGLLRYPKCLYKTATILLNNKPDVLFVQNPSMILASFASLYKIFFRRRLIIDRHTTFRLQKQFKFRIRDLIFIFLHYFTVKAADITIVTNNYLSDIVCRMKGRPFVLPDRLPTIYSKNKIKLKNTFNILLISSFGEDEPYLEAINAVRSFSESELTLYISGNSNKIDHRIITSSPVNVVFTGFLQEHQYIDLLLNVDAAMALTTADYCMLCGCYEAISAEKPLITSDKIVLEEYFRGSIFVDNTGKGISNAIKDLMLNYKAHLNNVKRLKEELLHKQKYRQDLLEKIIRDFK